MGGGQNPYNPLKNKGRNKKIITIIIFLVLIVASISFAIFSPSINLLGRRNIKISKCELDINFKESDELMLVSKYPISKDEALKYNAKDINITNNSTCDTAYYKLTIKDLNNSSINKDKINYQLIDKSDNSEIVDKNPDNFLVEDSLTKGNSKSYSIRIWIDESATNTDLYVNGDTTKPIEYKYALSIDAYDEKKENVEIVPILNIPVGTNGIEKVTHEIDDTLQVDSRFAAEYRYRGGNVANYVTFNNEVWRIIGVIPTEDTNGNVEYRIKIIRDEAPYSLEWNNCTINDEGKCDNTGKYENDWTGSSLNDYLNNYDYLQNLTLEARSMIGATKYYLGGLPRDMHDAKIDNVWQYERKKANESSETYFYDTNPIMQNDEYKKIALMYTSDYGYGSSESCTAFDSTNCYDPSSNWLTAQNINELLLTPASNISGIIYATVVGNGIIDNYMGKLPIRPVLTLSSKVKIKSGNGSFETPYKLESELNTINFKIDNIEYKAYEGMTWGEWVSSDFNTLKLKKLDECIVTDNEENYISLLDEEPIEAKEVIRKENYNYN